MVHSKHYYIGLVKKTLFYVLVVVLCAIFLSPFIIMFTTSMKTNYDAFQIPVQCCPQMDFTLPEALAKIPYIKYMMNTIFITALSVLGSMSIPPSVREICDAVGLKSTSTVHGHLSRLEKKGLIRRDPTKPRAIEILDSDFDAPPA